MNVFQPSVFQPSVLILVALGLLPWPLGCDRCCNVSEEPAAPAAVVEEEIIAVQPVAEGDSVPNLSLESLGAKLRGEPAISAIDFSSATLPKTGKFTADEIAKVQSVRVVRGKGRLPGYIANLCTAMPRLTEFLWTETDVEPAATKDFIVLKELKKVRITGLKSASVVPVLKYCALFPALVELDLSGSELTDDQLREAFAGGGFNKLVKLNLYQTKVGDAGVKALLPLASQLESLNLDATAVTDAGCETIAKFDILTFLHLGRTAITDAAAEPLGTLEALKTLHVTRTKMTDKGFDALKKKLPNCQLVTVATEPAK